jgi:beta-glucosidase
MAAGLIHKFPKNFIFGTATASYQIEGAAQEDGRGESIWDRFSRTPGKVLNGDTGDVACDHYHRVDEDIALMKALGTTAYRFSIAWPRIIPDGEGAVNQKGLDWYARLADKLLAAGIEPWATMYHWDLPQALEEKYGGWRSRQTAEAFRRYADVTVKHLGRRIKRWMTLNEMSCTIFLGYRDGRHAPGAKEPPAVVNQIQHHVLLAHGHGVRAVREHGGRGARVGQAYNTNVFLPVYETPEHIEAAAKCFADSNGPQAEPMQRGTYPAKWLAKIGADAPKVEPGDMELIASPTDFVGENIYLGAYVRAADNADGYQQLDFPPSYPRAYADWIKMTPQSLYWGTRFLHDLYGYREFYITENGSCMNDQLVNGEVLDTDRLEYYREYLKAAARVVAEKYPLKGYFAWSLMDNFEWAMGYSQRFGLHYVDYQTQKRTPKLSAKFYAACIKARQVL